MDTTELPSDRDDSRRRSRRKYRFRPISHSISSGRWNDDDYLLWVRGWLIKTSNVGKASCSTLERGEWKRIHRFHDLATEQAPRDGQVQSSSTDQKTQTPNDLEPRSSVSDRPFNSFMTDLWFRHRLFKTCFENWFSAKKDKHFFSNRFNNI